MGALPNWMCVLFVYPAGSLIMAATGPVLGLQACPVVVPNILAEFKQAWSQMASSAPLPAAQTVQE